MNYHVNRSKTRLHDYLIMAAFLPAQIHRIREDEYRPEVIDRIALLRQSLADLADGLMDFRIADRFLFFNLLKHLPASVVTPHDYVTIARQYIAGFDDEAYLRNLCLNLDLSYPGTDLHSIQTMLRESSFDDREKWIGLMIFTDPKTYLLRMIDRLEEVFDRLGPLYQPLAADRRDRLDELSDDTLIDDFKLIQETFTQDLERFEEVEIVPVIFQPYSASLFAADNRVQVALGIDFADSIRHARQFDTKQKSDFFKNLSDPTRYDMLKLLVRGDYTNKQLADILGVTAPNITYHFRTLLKDGLVRVDLDSERPRYRINRERFNQILLELSDDLNLSGRE